MTMATASIRKLLFTLAVLALGGLARAAAPALPGAAPAEPEPLPAYAEQRLRSFFVSYKRSGIQPLTIDLDRLDACLAALRTHAGNPTPRFNNAAEETQARNDAVHLGLTLARITKHDVTSPELLLRAALALSLAHNLGAPGADELAESRFKRLLDKLPKNSEALHEYGVYLVNSGRAEQAVAPLQQALAAGEPRARWPLALALAATGQTAQAQSQLETLQDRHAGLARDYPVATALATLRVLSNPASPPAPRP
jgi:Flp pilus assembly protein TadD